jgi:hypothetical protein
LAASLDRQGWICPLAGLGTPKEGRLAVRARHPERMEVIFREHMTYDRARAGWRRRRGLLANGGCPCFERDHATAGSLPR